MPKVAFDVDLKGLERMINQLRPQDRVTLIRRMEQNAWGDRMRTVFRQIDRKRKKSGKITHKEVLKLVKAARQERYAASRS